MHHYKKMKKEILILLGFMLVAPWAFAQQSKDFVDYSNPKKYTIGGISVTGTQYIDQNVLIMLSGLRVGDKIKIPGDDISNALRKLWKQGMFENIDISYNRVQGNTVFLKIQLSEHPRLSKFAFKGVKKTEADDLREEMGIMREDVITENVNTRIRNEIEKYFIDKGFLNVTTNIIQEVDTSNANHVILVLKINKGSKVKIRNIHFNGNYDVADGKLAKQMKETKEKKFWRVWKASKYIESDFKEDLDNAISYYASEGYRDARIVTDSVKKVDDKLIDVYVSLIEGKKFYFGNIEWIGNTKYPTDILNKVLGIKEGDVYNQKKLETRLYMDMEKGDVHSLYMDMGYLFSSISPIEKSVRQDTIDLEIRIYEGKQARIKTISIKGNTKTHDHVILREIRSKPGELFNRSDIIRTQRELAQLQYFDAEKLGVNPVPNPVDGTVDIEYTVEETSSDQIEMSIGWGLGRLIGTVGVSFNNFSSHDFFKKDSWNPIPAGDGQKLSLRMQSNGIYYSSGSVSFTEPWLGGRKKNALTVSTYWSQQTNGLTSESDDRAAITIAGVSVGLGKQLRWPDDFFMLYTAIGYQNYKLEDYPGIFTFDNGRSNNVNLNLVLSRNSIDNPRFPTEGSEISLSGEFTPPHSLLWGSKNDYTTMSDQDKFKWVEYHKWKFNASWYTALGSGKVARDLVLHSRAKFGFLGYYNSDIGDQPFERFYLGGSGLSGFSLDGRELVGMRGYLDNSLTPKKGVDYIGGAAYSKYTLELRYPISKNPMASIYLLGFLEAGNTYVSLKKFNPYDVHRSAGVGARIFLPMFGLIGLDWGYGFDDIQGSPGSSGSQFHFSINGSID